MIKTRYSSLVLWDHVTKSQLTFVKDGLIVVATTEGEEEEYSEENVNLIVAVAVIAGNQLASRS